MQHAAFSTARRCASAFALVSGLCGCESTLPVTQSYIDAPLPAGVGSVIEVRLEPCIDRTGTSGRDLGAEATKAFRDKLPAASGLVVKDAARYRLNCEVTSFVEGSALKRWVMPGWGATTGQVAAMMTDIQTGEIVAIARSNATVGGGGLYSAGADSYIVAAAVQDVLNQFQAWVKGRGGTRGATGR